MANKEAHGDANRVKQTLRSLLFQSVFVTIPLGAMIYTRQPKPGTVQKSNLAHAQLHTQLGSRYCVDLFGTRDWNFCLQSHETTA